MPNRIIKESICTSEKLAELTDFEFRLWVGLIVSVDDYGRGDARARIIKGRVFPLRERVTVKEIEDALNSLAAKGCISLYDVGGSSYFWFPTWANHQRIQTKKSKFPEPEDGEIRKSTVNHRESPPESNPIQSESNPNPRESIGAAAPTSAKREYGEYGWVKLTDGQYAKLLSDLGQAELDRCIAYIDESAQSNGNKNKWKDWNLVIRKCNREGWGKRGQKETQQSGYNGSVPDYDADRSDSF